MINQPLSQASNGPINQAGKEAINERSAAGNMDPWIALWGKRHAIHGARVPEPEALEQVTFALSILGIQTGAQLLNCKAKRTVGGRVNTLPIFEGFIK